jgi:tetratricopeptide (TPR) repeat protein
LDAGTSILFLRQLAGERIEWLKVGLDAATHQNLLAAQGRHWCNLGRTYHNYSGQKREEIISCLENALAIAQQVNNLRDEGQALGNLGVVYRDWGKLDLAREYFAKRLKLARQLNDEHSEASTLGNIGKLLLKEKDYKGAAEKFEEQLSMALRLGYIHLQCQALGNKGQALAGLGITDSAIDHLRSSINLARELGARRAEAGARGELGNVLFDVLGNYSAAKQIFEESLRIAREVQFGRGEFQALKSLSAVSTKMGDEENESAHYESALKYYEEMLLLINRTPNPKNEGLTLWNVAQLNKKLGRIPQACIAGSKSERLLADSGLKVVFRIRKELRRWGCTTKR